MSIQVIHIPPHLGGGVGKALTTLVTSADDQRPPMRHRILCLEPPEKTQFLDQIRAQGTEVIIAPNSRQLSEQIDLADIVQLEWWNHPATFAALCALQPRPMRLLIWCHTSGLYNPIIPAGLLDAAHRFVFTSPCSHQAPNVRERMGASNGNKFLTISSASGFHAQPINRRDRDSTEPLRVGYVGSLNFSKLHPDFVAYLAAVQQPRFCVRLIGDPLNQHILQQQCAALNRPKLLEFRGYSANVEQDLRQLDVLAYLLNPRHYGTAENALLEAMAVGVVPIVLNNPAETSIVTDRQTGLIVDTPTDFAAAIDWLANHPEERIDIGQRAAQHITRQFTADRMQAAFTAVYQGLAPQDKQGIAFQSIFGHSADDWFLASQLHPEWFASDGGLQIPANEPTPFDLLDANKGSAFQFSRHFPENQTLRGWATALKLLQ